MENNKPKGLTEQERLELADKLDKELDDFIDNLPKRTPQEPIPLERWEEELTNHPFFMKELPENGAPLHPLYEGLQKLKYDPEENEPEELALAYKDDGNFNFKHKKYRMAIISYTEGLNAKCGNDEIDATLYNNRAAAHYLIQNYKSSLRDCESALKLKPDYEKALTRAGNCYMALKKYEKAIELCDTLLDKDKNHKDALKLRQDSVVKLREHERDKRKKERENTKRRQEEQQIVSEILSRGIRVEDEKSLSLASLEPKFPQLFDSRINVNEQGQLLWPVVLFYPEYKIMDYVQQFNEHMTFQEQLQEVFGETPPWDTEKKYTPASVNVYYENDRKKIIKVDVKQTLGQVLKSAGLIVEEGTPRFIILVGNSPVEAMFLNRQ